jgi:hypothetical protein
MRGYEKMLWVFFASFRRTPDRSPGQAPESSAFKGLRTDWNLVFTGVTAKIRLFQTFRETEETNQLIQFKPKRSTWAMAA